MQVIGHYNSAIVDELWLKICNHESLYYVFIDPKGEVICTREGTQKQIAMDAHPAAMLVGVYDSNVLLGELHDDVTATFRERNLNPGNWK